MLRKEIKQTLKHGAQAVISTFGTCVKSALCVLTKSPRDQIYAVPSSNNKIRTNSPISGNDENQLEQRHSCSQETQNAINIIDNNLLSKCYLECDRSVNNTLELPDQVKVVKNNAPTKMTISNSSQKLTSVMIHDTVANKNNILGESLDDDSDVIMEIPDEDFLTVPNADHEAVQAVSSAKTGGRSQSREAPAKHYISNSRISSATTNGSLPKSSTSDSIPMTTRKGSLSANLEGRRPQVSNLKLKRHSLHGSPSCDISNNLSKSSREDASLANAGDHGQAGDQGFLLFPGAQDSEQERGDGLKISREIIYKSGTDCYNFLSQPAVYALPAKAFKMSKRKNKNSKATSPSDELTNDTNDVDKIEHKQNHGIKLLESNVWPLRELELDDIVI